MDRRVSVTVDADISPFNRAMLSGVASAKAFTRELESSDSRMANLVQTGLALAPALVPLGAAAVPMLASVASGLTLTVGAAGAAVLAFQGVGDALDALNDYHLKPTSENYQKLRDKMDAIGPAGRDFVFFLDDLRPRLQDLQDIAQDGLLPGVQEGIEETLQLLPQVESVIDHISTALGDLTAEAGDSLNDERWVEFFDYLDREGGPTLKIFGRTLGNLVDGFTNMVMAFDPLADMFNEGLLKSSRAFVAWSEGLDESQGFQEFVDYVRTNGPEAMDTLGSLAGALIELVEAAAPVGSAVLPILRVMADTFSAVADSPIGPVVVGAAAAVGTLGRSLALLDAVGLRGENKNVFSRIFDPGKLKAGVSALDVTSRATDKARLSVTAFDKAERERQATFRAGVGQLGRWAAGAAGIAIATTGIADDLGLANTATFALTGAMVGGVPGAIAGGLVGAVMDYRDATKTSDDATRSWNAALRSTSSGVDQFAAAVAQARSEVANLEGSVPTGLGDALMQSLTPGGIAMNSEALFGDLDNTAVGKAALQANDLEMAYGDLVLSLNEVGKALGSVEWGESVTDVEGLQDILTRARPAMDALGISVEDLLAAARDGSIVEMSDQIADWVRWSDSGTGRTRRLAEAFQGLEDDMQSTVTSAEALKNALDAVLGPGLNLSAATDAWREGIRNLDKDLAKHSRSLTANTNAADKNREAIRDRVVRLKDLITAEAEAGASPEKLTRMLRGQREALLDAGEAAGLSRKDLRKYLDELGLTPKMVRTVIQLNTQSAMESLRQARRELEAMNGKRYTAIMEIHTVRTGAGGQGAGYDGAADGATVPKTGLPYADRHLYLLADGEEVVSNRVGGADRNRAELKAASRGAKLQIVGGLADGGTSGAHYRSSTPDVPAIGTAAQATAMSLRNLESMTMKQVNALRKDLAAREELRAKELQRERDRLDMLQQEKRAFADLVASVHVSEIFGQQAQGFSFSGATLPDNFNDLTPEEQQTLVANQAALMQAQYGLNQQLATQQEQGVLDADIENLDQALALLEVLRAKGLDGPAFRELAAKGDVATLRRYAEMTRKQLHTYERQFERRAELAGDLGRWAGQREFGAAIRDQVAEVKQANELHRQSVRELKVATKHLAHMRKLAERAPKDIGREVARGVNGAARAAQKGRAA